MVIVRIHFDQDDDIIDIDRFVLDLIHKNRSYLYPKNPVELNNNSYVALAGDKIWFEEEDIGIVREEDVVIDFSKEEFIRDIGEEKLRDILITGNKKGNELRYSLARI